MFANTETIPADLGSEMLNMTKKRYQQAAAYEVKNSLTGETMDPQKPAYVAKIGSNMLCVTEEQLIVKD